jgi:hypothetical protein
MASRCNNDKISCRCCKKEKKLFLYFINVIAQLDQHNGHRNQSTEKLL